MSSALAQDWLQRRLERLRNQRVGQYLRAANATYGVFLLFRASKNRHWQTSGGGRVSWDELLRQLRSVAQEDVDQRPDIDRLEVLGIDVTPPML